MSAMKYFLMIAATVCVSLIAGCEQTIDWVHDLEKGDFSTVRFERCPPGMQPFEPEGEMDQYVSLVRDMLQQNQPLLNTIAGQCPTAEPSSLDNFQLQSVWTDTLDQGLMVQFFARYEHPMLYEGRKLQFVLDKHRQLVAIYVHDEPLER